MKFLESICTMCRDCFLLEDMDAFCREMELAENIKVRGHMAGWGRGKALERQPPVRLRQGEVETNHAQTPSCPREDWVCCWAFSSRHGGLVSATSHPGCALQVLLEEEPTDSLHTALRMKAMLTIATLRYLPSPYFGQHIPGQCPGGPDAGRKVSHPSQGCLSMGRHVLPGTCLSSHGCLSSFPKP